MTTFDPRTVHSMQAPQFGAPQLSTQQFAGQQFPGLVPPPALSKPPRNRRPMAAKIVAGLVAAGLVVGGAGTWLAFSGSSAEAAVQSTSFAGANPTTSPFGTDAPQVAAVAATGPQSGGTTGLFAATTPPACTTADFLAQLRADPTKLAAFGGVYGIGSTDVPAFVNSLSPVVLRANTSVTDHPFADGAFVPQPAVLAAGTAVLVNSYGEPTVKCFNGNPLTAGAVTTQAVTIVPTAQVITQFSFTTIDNSRVVVIPGKPDPKPNPGPNPTTTPQPDPALVKQARDAKATADQARTEATAARDKADSLGVQARVFRSEADRLAGIATAAQTTAGQAAKALVDAQNALNNALLAVPPVQAAKDKAQADLAAAQAANTKAAGDAAKAQSDATKADDDADTAENQFKYAGSAATSAEGSATAAEKNAKEAQDKADASAKVPAADKDKDKDAKPAIANQENVDGQAAQNPVEGQQAAPDQTTGTEGQVKPAQVGTNAQVCKQVVNDAATAPICPLTGSADTATGTTPATSGTATTSGEKTSTGSGTGTSSGTSKGSSSSSSSATSGSESSAKGGSDK
jgi:hypothetical protein